MNPMTDDPGAQDAVVIERSLAAPREIVWQMWTNPEHFKVWYGPDGVTIPTARMDVRVGGARLICMEMTRPGGPMQMWFAGEYLEVTENERLTYTDFMSDSEGKALSPAETRMPEGHPAVTEVRVELEEVGGRTRMVLTHSGIPADSPGAAGWAMAIDKLAAQIEGHAELN